MLENGGEKSVTRKGIVRVVYYLLYLVFADMTIVKPFLFISGQFDRGQCDVMHVHVAIQRIRGAWSHRVVIDGTG